MANTPLVSIIMPLYNKRPYVKRALESIRQQTFTHWELIVVDDGSTDGSSDEIPRDDSRIRLVRQENRGPSAARNRGIEMASGEYVTFIDADDYYFPQKLEKEMDFLWKKNLAEWMISASEFEINNEVIFQYIKDKNGDEVKEEMLVVDNALNQLTVAGWPSDGICIKKNLLDRLGGFCKDMWYGEITEFEIRCAVIQPRMVICQIPLYRVVDVPKSVSTITSYRIEGMRQMGKSLYELSMDYPEFSKLLSLRARSLLYSYAATLSFAGRGSEAREYLIHKFPYTRDRRWWKMWIGSWMPTWMLHHIVRTSSDLKQT